MSDCAKYFSYAFMSGYTYLSSQEYDLFTMTKRPQHTILKLNQSITYHCTGQNGLQWLLGGEHRIPDNLGRIYIRYEAAGLNRFLMLTRVCKNIY